MKKIFAHGIFLIIGFLIVFGPPLLYSRDYWMDLFSSDVDVITSASVILDKPTGNYVVLINKDFHKDEDVLNEWINFFSGNEVSYIFEDISCAVSLNDVAAVEMSESLRSRLPENQMRIAKDNQTLLSSRIDYNKFDIVVMSKEFVEANKVEIIENNGYEIVRIIP